MRIRHVRLLYLAICMCVVSARAQIVIRGTAADADPAVYLGTVSGSPSVGSLLKATLKRCGWLTVVETPSQAAYSLAARYTPTPAPTLEVKLTAAGGRTVLHFRQAEPDRDDRRLVYKTVDTILNRLFEVPGLCSTKVAFVAGKSGLKEIFVCNFDGSELTQLTHNRSISTEPSWGPGARSMVYTLYNQNRTDVITVDMVGDRQRRLSHFRGLNAGADLSPDGRRAAICLSQDGQVDLYLIGADGSPEARLTRDRTVESSPCWSPDGRAVCYVSDRTGTPQLYLISAGGGNPVPLTGQAREAVSPDWSAASNRICFATRQGGQYVIAVVDMAGSERTARVVTTGPGDWEAPTWGPDGRHLMCTRDVGGQREICMVDVETQQVLRVTKAGNFSLPSWSDPH